MLKTQTMRGIYPITKKKPHESVEKKNRNQKNPRLRPRRKETKMGHKIHRGITTHNKPKRYKTRTKYQKHAEEKNAN